MTRVLDLTQLGKNVFCLIIIAFFFFVFPPHSFSDTPMLREEVAPQSLGVFVNPSFFALAANNKLITGLALGGGVNYALRPNLGLGAGIRQGYSSGVGTTSSVLFFAIDVNAEFALSGHLSHTNRSISLDGQEIVESVRSEPYGWRIIVGFAQYFLNSAVAAIPFSGGGVGVEYQLPLMDGITISPGIKTDRISNGVSVFYPTNGSLKLLFYL